MKRRNFLQSLGALAFAPMLPSTSLALANAAPAIPASTYSWAETIVRAHKTCNVAMLQRHLQIDAASASALKSQLVKKGVISAQANSYGLHTATKPLFEGAFIRLEKPLHTAHDLVKKCSTKDSFETADIEADFDTTEEHNFSVEELEEIALLGTEIDDTSLVQTLNS